jgi:hypothetical protein
MSKEIVAAHTPGPWTANRDLKTSINAGEKHIAMVNFWKSPNDASSVYGDEHEANGRLIASAPDLLAALKVMSAHYSGSLDYQPPYVAMGRAAIAKAEGASQ